MERPREDRGKAILQANAQETSKTATKEQWRTRRSSHQGERHITNPQKPLHHLSYTHFPQKNAPRHTFNHNPLLHCHDHKNLSRNAKKNIPDIQGWIKVTHRRERRVNRGPIKRPLHPFIQEAIRRGACFRCGSIRHIKAHCREPVKCHLCSKYGHLARHCKGEIRVKAAPTPKVSNYSTVNPNTSYIEALTQRSQLTSTPPNTPQIHKPLHAQKPTAHNQNHENQRKLAAEMERYPNWDTMPMNDSGDLWDERPETLDVFFPRREQLRGPNAYLAKSAYITLLDGVDESDLPFRMKNMFAARFGWCINAYHIIKTFDAEYLLVCNNPVIRDLIVDNSHYELDGGIIFTVQAWSPSFAMQWDPPLHRARIRLRGAPLQTWNPDEIRRLIAGFSYPIQISPYFFEDGQLSYLRMFIACEHPTDIPKRLRLREGEYKKFIEVVLEGWMLAPPPPPSQPPGPRRAPPPNQTNRNVFQQRQGDDEGESSYQPSRTPSLPEREPSGPTFDTCNTGWAKDPIKQRVKRIWQEKRIRLMEKENEPRPDKQTGADGCKLTYGSAVLSIISPTYAMSVQFDGASLLGHQTVMNTQLMFKIAAQNPMYNPQMSMFHATKQMHVTKGGINAIVRLHAGMVTNVRVWTARDEGTQQQRREPLGSDFVDSMEIEGDNQIFTQLEGDDLASTYELPYEAGALINPEYLYESLFLDPPPGFSISYPVSDYASQNWAYAAQFMQGDLGEINSQAQAQHEIAPFDHNLMQIDQVGRLQLMGPEQSGQGQQQCETLRSVVPHIMGPAYFPPETARNVGMMGFEEEMMRFNHQQANSPLRVANDPAHHESLIQPELAECTWKQVEDLTKAIEITQNRATAERGIVTREIGESSNRRSSRLNEKNKGKYSRVAGQKRKVQKKKQAAPNPFDFTGCIDVPIALDQAQTLLDVVGIPLKPDLNHRLEEIIRADMRRRQEMETNARQGPTVEQPTEEATCEDDMDVTRYLQGPDHEMQE